MLIDIISKKFTLFITRDVYNEAEDIEVINFGVIGILSNLINLFVALMISVYFNYLNSLLLYLIIFIPLRINHKSFHCDTFINCVIYSNIMLYVNIFLLRTIVIDSNLLCLIFIFVLFLHYFISIEKNKRITLYVAIIFLIGLAINLEISLAALLSVLTNYILIIGGKLK